MQTETNISLPSKIFRSNSLDIDVQVNVDLTDYTIEAELFDRFYSSIKLSSNVVTEIEIIDEDEGTFTLHFAKNLTDLFHLNSYLEITLIDEDGKEQTIWFDVIKFTDDIYLRA